MDECYIIECTKTSKIKLIDYRKIYQFLLKDSNETFYSEFRHKNRASKPFSGEKYYAAIYKFEFNNKKYTFVSQVYKNKEEAIESISESKKLKFIFNENNSIQIYDNIKDGFDVFFNSSILFKIGIYLISCTGLLYLFSISQTFQNQIFAILFFVIVITTLYERMRKTYARDTQKYGYLIDDIDVNNIQKNIIYSNDFEKDKDEYKSIMVNYNITPKSVILKNDRLNCKWIFERDELGLLSPSGQKVIHELQEEDGTCALTIKYNGENNSEFKSKCGNYWISEESI